MESKKGLFLRNLPYNATDEELNEFFSHYGETKACFIIKNNEGQSKGYGFVYYKSSENAMKAKKSVKKFNGRLITVEFAKRKQENKLMDDMAESRNDKEDSDDEDDYEMQTSQQQQQQQQQKKTKARDSVSDKQSHDIGRIVVLEGLEESVTTRQIRVRCRKIGEVESVECPVPGRQIKTAFVKYVKHKDARVAVTKFDGKFLCGGSVKAVLMSKEGKNPSKLTLKKSRLLVRNLEFKCSEETLREVFSPHGNVIEVHIPKKNDRSRGYGFVQYTSYFDALKALETINGTLIKGRKVAVDFIASKNAKEVNDKEMKVQNGTIEKDDSNDVMDEKMSDIEMKEDEVNEEQEENENQEDGGSGDDGDRGDDGDSDDSDRGDDGDSDDGDSDENQTSDNEQLKKDSNKMVDDVKEGKTLFIRNVPYDADEEELNGFMERFGHVRYCRLVQGGITGMCRGTAFVQYKHEPSVRQCLEAANSNEGIPYNGSRLDVTLALSKKELHNLKKKQDTANTTDNNKSDKRNLYLLREGVILKDSDAAKDISKAELLRRIKSYDERKRKLKNPYYYISKTRLSVRNLPVLINEKRLKGLFKSHAGNNSTIKQVKLMRSKDKFTEEGLGRPLGFGFVEFTQHESALNALRDINNNPSIFGAQRRPIVEFALEDSRAIKLMKERKNQNHGSNDTDDVHHNNPKVKWKLKCKARRLRRKEDKVQGGIAKSKQSGEKENKDKKKLKKEEFTQRRPLKTERTRRIVHETERNRMKKKLPKINTKTAKHEKKFNDLVDKYRNKLLSQDSRWFE